MAPLWGQWEGAWVAWHPFSGPVSLSQPLHLCAGGETEHRRGEDQPTCPGSQSGQGASVPWLAGVACGPARSLGCGWGRPQDRERWWVRAGTGLGLPSPPRCLRLCDIGESLPFSGPQFPH